MPHDNHKGKSCSNYIKEHDIEVKAFWYQRYKTEKREQHKKRGVRDLQNNQKTISKMTIVSLYLSIISLNANGLTSPIKSHRMAEQIKKMFQQYVAYKIFTLTLKTHID